MASKTLTRRDVLRMAGAGGTIALATACGAGAPKSDAGGGSFTIYWNAGHGYETYEKVIAEFEQAHGVTVNFQKYQWPGLHHHRRRPGRRH